jgi:biopolymer transport protein ExbD
MAGGASSGDEEIYTINVTPLVDITLVLLIIMMVTAKVIVATGMQVELPKAASGEDVPKVFTVDMTSDGKTFFQKTLVPNDEDLTAKAKDAKSKNEEVRAVIRADEKVEHGSVVHIIDVLKNAGVQKIAFAVTPVAPTRE